MSLEAAYNLSISDLLRVLSEKLGLESSKLRGISLPLTCLASSLESEIDSLEAKAQDVLKLIPSLRNIVRPVNRSPPEILSYIAQYLIGNDEDDAISVVPLTHVCRYWRKSIISTPEIWAFISGKNKGMTATCLERAKAAPLKITLHMPLGSSFTEIFALYLQNTRSLVVRSISTIGELTSVFPNFPQSTPTLRSLELIRPQVTDWNRTIDPFESFIPPLERLRLIGVPLYASLLRLGTLTEFTFSDRRFDLRLDTLLDFLEGNHSLEKVTLDIYFPSNLLLKSHRKIAMKNHLRYLSINCRDRTDVKALVSNIPLQRGAGLRIHLGGESRTLSDFLPNVSTAHLSNPSSPTFFQLGHGPTNYITLDGPSGNLSFFGLSTVSFADLAVLPLVNIREVRLCYRKGTTKTTREPPVFYPSYFPALETLTIDCNADVLGILSVLLSNLPPSPSLKTIGFLNCNLSQDFMDKLTRFASERQNIPTSTWLHRVQIVHSNGAFPSAASVRRLRKYVKVVEFRMEDEFSVDLVSMASLTTPPCD